MNRTLDEFAVLLKHQFHGKNIHLYSESGPNFLVILLRIKYCFTFEIFFDTSISWSFPRLWILNQINEFRSFLICNYTSNIEGEQANSQPLKSLGSVKGKNDKMYESLAKNKSRGNFLDLQFYFWSKNSIYINIIFEFLRQDWYGCFGQIWKYWRQKLRNFCHMYDFLSQELNYIFGNTWILAQKLEKNSCKKSKT